MSAEYAKPGDVIAGKYRIEHVLGEGGMGTVVAARHLHLDQLVALKFMRTKALAFDNAVQRFFREAKAVARLRGANIAQVMDVGTLQDGTPYIVMEYLEGVDLATLMSEVGALSVEDAVDYMLQACAAMAEAHAADIVHRDLKPANLFVTQHSSGAPLIKVLDFGLSKYGPQNSGKNMVETATYGTMGSPPYMSPEQVKSAKYVDQRADIWSLGVILYYTLCGKLPFVANSVPEIFSKILTASPQPLSQQIAWSIPPRLDAVVMRCLAKEPSERYEHVRDLALDLMQFASDEGRALVDLSHISTDGALRAPSQPGIVESSDPSQPNVHVAGPSRLDLGRLMVAMKTTTNLPGRRPPEQATESVPDRAPIVRNVAPGIDLDGATVSMTGYANVAPPVVPSAMSPAMGGVDTHQDPHHNLAARPVASYSSTMHAGTQLFSRRKRITLIGVTAAVVIAVGLLFVTGTIGTSGAGASGDADQRSAAPAVTEPPAPATERPSGGADDTTPGASSDTGDSISEQQVDAGVAATEPDKGTTSKKPRPKYRPKPKKPPKTPPKGPFDQLH